MNPDKRLEMQNQLIKSAIEELQFTLNDSFYEPQFRKSHLRKAEEFLKEAIKIQDDRKTT